uniref:Cytosolic endo-beta-N-acetylglucosaminidase n=1 Tax=Trichogramma kaykai TaxID=54128 RepID=A0ABD2WL15_9HYME
MDISNQSATMQENERTVKPFKNLEELYKRISSLASWQGVVNLRKSTDYVYSADETQIENKKKISKTSVPKTIVCHDLMGGYLEDRFIDGSNNHNSYHFYHWHIIDTFIYFSHHFVTIPPFGWINAAHEHGVKILGTLITENTEGKENWDEILKTRDNIVKFADALVFLAQFYKFDGWLLNVENEIHQDDVGKLTFFVRYLTDTIHKRVENSEIIWYDSVTESGKLSWQNELNEKNNCFFERCDGIFLNYTWSDSGLIKSAIKAEKQNRLHDVYVGLDVWGRGCPGGGGFNSAHALKRIRRQGLSVAIFAPAWTFEYFGPQTFPRIENIFWAQLKEFLYIHVPVFRNERFITTLCRGAGDKYFEYGMQIRFEDPKTHTVVERNNSFYNLAMQKHQTISACSHLKFISSHMPLPLKMNEKSDPIPQEWRFETAHEVIKTLGNKLTIEDKPESYAGLNCQQFSYDVSYEGGGCLKLMTKNTKSFYRLFYVHIELSRDIQVRVYYRNSDMTNHTHDSEKRLVLLLGNESGVTSFLPRQTLEHGLGWHLSIFQTNMKIVEEIGLAVTHTGDCYIGKIVVEEMRRPMR